MIWCCGFIYNFAKSEPIWMKSGALLSTLEDPAAAPNECFSYPTHNIKGVGAWVQCDGRVGAGGQHCGDVRLWKRMQTSAVWTNIMVAAGVHFRTYCHVNLSLAAGRWWQTSDKWNEIPILGWTFIRRSCCSNKQMLLFQDLAWSRLTANK